MTWMAVHKDLPVASEIYPPLILPASFSYEIYSIMLDIRAGLWSSAVIIVIILC